MFDPADERGVPTSTGVPLVVRVSAIVGLVVILGMVGLVIYASAFGHAWPWTTGAQVKLG
jgi:hypothetical protein